MSEVNNTRADLFGTVLRLVPIYTAYLFVCGWAYNFYYFASFNLDQRFLDIGFSDTVVRGVTAIFQDRTSLPLLLLLLLLLLIPALITVLGHKHLRWANALMLVVLLIFITGYFFYRTAGIERAELDKGPQTRLPSIIFRDAGVACMGKLLYVKGDTYFIHDVRPVSGGATPLPQLSILRASELSEVKVIEHGQE